MINAFLYYMFLNVSTTDKNVKAKLSEINYSTVIYHDQTSTLVKLSICQMKTAYFVKKSG